MNCVECRDNLVGSMEGLLDAEVSNELRTHLHRCAECRAELKAFNVLHEQLTRSAAVSANAYFANPVMNEVRDLTRKPHQPSLLQFLLNNPWKIGFSAAAVCVLILIFCGSGPNAQAKGAAAVMMRGARAAAKFTRIHLRGQVRTYPQDNFSFIKADLDFQPIELWKELQPQLKWRVEKPGRIALMDGKETFQFIKPQFAAKIPEPCKDAFDTFWLHRIANLSTAISNEVRHAQAEGWKLELTADTAADGKTKSIVTVHTTSGIPDNDYLKNVFFDNADTRRVYRFDDETERLEAVQIYLKRDGSEVKIFELTQIDYDQPIDASVWKIDLPADVVWCHEPEKLADNAKYEAMTSDQAARAFFEACSHSDWNEVEKFMSPLTSNSKQYLGGMEILDIGKSFRSKAYPGEFVPYKIRFATRQKNVRLSNNNAAKRYVVVGVYDAQMKLIEDLPWTSAPEILTNNDVYAAMSAEATFKTIMEAFVNTNWTELRKFAPESFVEKTKREFAEAEKEHFDVRKALGQMFKVGETFWSPDYSSYFVKVYQSEVKSWNLALRRDNPANRWQVDGGL